MIDESMWREFDIIAIKQVIDRTDGIINATLIPQFYGNDNALFKSRKSSNEPLRYKRSPVDRISFDFYRAIIRAIKIYVSTITISENAF